MKKLGDRRLERPRQWCTRWTVVFSGFALSAAVSAFAAPDSSPRPNGSLEFKQETLNAWLRKQLPEKLQKLSPGKTTPQEVQATLGPAAEQPSPEVSYFVTAGVRFDTTLRWKRGVLESVTFLWPRSPGNLSSLERWISKDRIQAAFTQLETEILAGRDAAGRTLVISLPEEGLTLEFASTGDRLLKKATFSVPARKKSGPKANRPREGG